MNGTPKNIEKKACIDRPFLVSEHTVLLNFVSVAGKENNKQRKTRKAGSL